MEEPEQSIEEATDEAIMFAVSSVDSFLVNQEGANVNYFKTLVGFYACLLEDVLNFQKLPSASFHQIQDKFRVTSRVLMHFDPSLPIGSEKFREAVKDDEKVNECLRIFRTKLQDHCDRSDKGVSLDSQHHEDWKPSLIQRDRSKINQNLSERLPASAGYFDLLPQA